MVSKDIISFERTSHNMLYKLLFFLDNINLMHARKTFNLSFRQQKEDNQSSN